MSVDCDMYCGYTVQIREKLTGNDFRQLNDFLENNPKYNQYEDKNTVKLVIDGMNGLYARLIYVDKHNRYVWGDEDEPYQVIKKDLPEDVYSILNEAYQAIQGVPLDKKIVNYALWWHWH